MNPRDLLGKRVRRLPRRSLLVRLFSHREPEHAVGGGDEHETDQDDLDYRVHSILHARQDVVEKPLQDNEADQRAQEADPSEFAADERLQQSRNQESDRHGVAGRSERLAPFIAGGLANRAAGFELNHGANIARTSAPPQPIKTLSLVGVWGAVSGEILVLRQAQDEDFE
ncbi:hypothetical protein EIB18_15115 [Caulobacter vibrioides]|uniref:Uncharacterized protein n=1 Tax=Caulobacter vibrioides (strain ATCC 19089 / CIP 103742 / CB 15) TaxID=190650 RepID=Q9A4I1_CAUVC|nr:hypothetical protein CC_2850 [Caulobacter vibrioides CB15]ATC29683.1 hypothetical protein CA607_15365 [Caulobacter vibrioides]AZH13900.1 hypothetical protein EIB18_15115 [Caulobacter vibrioides]